MGKLQDALLVVVQTLQLVRMETLKDVQRQLKHLKGPEYTWLKYWVNARIQDREST